MLKTLEVDGQVIRDRRMKLGQTYMVAAEYVYKITGRRISHSTIARVEKNLQKPTIRTWALLCQSYGVNVKSKTKCPFCGTIID